MTRKKQTCQKVRQESDKFGKKVYRIGFTNFDYILVFKYMVIVGQSR